MYRMMIEGNPTDNENEMDENSGEQKGILNRTPRICRKRR